ncbi:MAG: hypothetical protein OEW50_13540 [Gammaproteobacteria bacterium]|jgi:uncharacterized membrane protein|nr:hypothetical protein [Gammaproteobacteria bacterium]MDH5228417.1 hypothetical protein [Gammaproteobacteria bacterium]
MNSPADSIKSADSSLVSYTHWMYALHAASALIGMFTSQFIATAFLFGIPSIVAVVMNYIRRSDARGTFLESHFSWQLRTFWFALLWVSVVLLLSIPLMVVLVGFATFWLGVVVIGIWVIYRVTRGWLRLKEGQPI